MKISHLFLFLALSLCYACSTDYDLTGEWQDIPIVYGLLSSEDTTHYLRVQRAYLTDESAIVAAGESDSIYYSDEVRVSVKEIDGAFEWILERFDGNTINLPKDEDGIFASDSNILYRFSAILNKNKSYQLEINNPATNKTSFAAIELVHPVVGGSTFPRAGVLTGIFPSANAQTNIRWNASKNSYVFDLKLKFNYREWNVNDPSNVLEKSITMDVAQNIENPDPGSASPKMEYDLAGRRFYNFLADNLTIDPDIRREFNSAQGLALQYYVGGEEFYNFNRVVQAQSGITAGQAVPIYTNIEGGFGVFSSRNFTEVGGILLNPPTIDSIACNPLTIGLNFQNSQFTFGCP